MSSTTTRPAKVLGSAVAVCEAAGGDPSTEREGNRLRDGGEGIGEVVQCVAQEGHRTGHQYDDQLEHSGGRPSRRS